MLPCILVNKDFQNRQNWVLDHAEFHEVGPATVKDITVVINNHFYCTQYKKKARALQLSTVKTIIKL